MADSTGQGRYVGQVDGTVLDATEVSFQAIYHADGETYHPLPNRREFETQGSLCRDSWGVDAMRHLNILQQWLF